MMWRGWLLVCLCVVGCGRIGYAPRPDASIDANVDAFALDAAPLDTNASRDAARADTGLDAFAMSDDASIDAMVIGDDAGLDAFVSIDVGNDVGSDVGTDVGIDGGSDAPSFDTGPDAALVNECLVGNGGCSINAMCVDLPVGRSCTCGGRFLGDGIVCVPIALGAGAQASFIKGSNTGPNDTLGTSVVLSSDGLTLAIGATGESSSGTGVNGTMDEVLTSSGAVYIYRRATTSAAWAFEAFIKASNTAEFDAFGVQLDLSDDGNVLAVAALSDGVSTNEGSVYLYRRTGTTWVFETMVAASSPGANDQFGFYLALSGTGDTLAVGVPFEDSSGVGPRASPFDDGRADSGGVYIFQHVGMSWLNEIFIKSTNPGANDQFGFFVALSQDGRTLAVGAPGEDSASIGVNGARDEGLTSSGAAYIFTHVGTGPAGWSEEAFLKSSMPAMAAVFGNAMGISGDGNVLAVAARTGGTGPTQTGAVDLYRRSAGGWSTEAFLRAPNAQAADFFGVNVALSADGNTLVVGVLCEDGSGTGVGLLFSEGAVDSGAAYVFRYGGTVWPFETYIKADSPGISDFFGAALTINQDGTRLIVGAPGEDTDATGVSSVRNEAAPNAGVVYEFRPT